MPDKQLLSLPRNIIVANDAFWSLASCDNEWYF
jgi:hypothetical protein